MITRLSQGKTSTAKRWSWRRLQLKATTRLWEAVSRLKTRRFMKMTMKVPSILTAISSKKRMTSKR